jgi:multidrug efflux pump subunit AcrB
VRDRAGRFTERITSWGVLVPALYVVVTGGVIAVAASTLGREIFPSGGGAEFQLRLRAPTGTKFETTERLAVDVLDEIRQAAGPGGVDITLGYVGVQPSSYPINTIFLWTSGSHEGVLQVALKPAAGLDLGSFEETLRRRLRDRFPDARFSFEPGDIVSRIMNFGTSTPVDVAVTGPDFAATRTFASKLRDELAKIPQLRDLAFGQALDTPAIQVDVNRQLAGQFGITAEDVGRSFAAATSSSRFVSPNYWADPRTGIAFQVQVEVPQPDMTSIADLRTIPVAANRPSHPLLGDVAQVQDATVIGEYDRINGQRLVSVTANIAGGDLGRVSQRVDRAIADAGALPRGARVLVRGQIAAMREMFQNIGLGLLVAVVAIVLLLTANFQSVRLALVAVSTVPAAIAGVGVMLAVTGTTINIESFMGAIMAIGVAVANAILLVTFAEQARQAGRPAVEAAVAAVRARLRPVLMTSATMIAGMAPMALGMGADAGTTVPLGRAVIGGLLAATTATVAVLPAIYALVQRSAGSRSRSLDPDDPASVYRTQEAR